MTYRPDYKLIPGEGPTSPGGLMAIGEAGGEWENLKGRPFAGKSGWLLDTYLAKNLIPRHRFFVTNIFPSWTGPGNPTPTKEQIEYGSNRLINDFLRLQPQYVLALGRTAADWFLGEISLEVFHGLPFNLHYRYSILEQGEEEFVLLGMDGGTGRRWIRSGLRRSSNSTEKSASSGMGARWTFTKSDLDPRPSVRDKALRKALPSGTSHTRSELQPSLRKNKEMQSGTCEEPKERKDLESGRRKEQKTSDSSILQTVPNNKLQEQSGSFTLVAAYHPAAALRDPETSGRCFYDLSQFSLIARGLLRPIVPVDVAPNPTYTLENRVCISGIDPAVDTEGFKDSPYCLSYSNRDGQATVVMAKDVRSGEPLNLSSSKITFHHSMHDLPVLRAMGFKVDSWGFDDTILMARLLLLEPAGLKDLALRHCKMKMRTYDEVVGPYFQKAVRRYILKSSKIDWGKPDAQAIRNKKTGKWAIYQPQPISNRLKAIVRDLQAGKPIDLKARWEKISPELRAPIERVLGAFPINHPRLAPLEELVQYSGRDPDATRRVKSKLWPMIVARKLVRAYNTDLHSIPMFERMAANGMQIDPDHFAAMRPAIVEKLEESGKDWCHRFNGNTHLNLASGDQVAEYLYSSPRGPRLKPLKQTRGGTRPSVDEKTLELLKDQHRSIPFILAWKKLHTNLTFVDRIPKWMKDDHRIYPNINTQGTITGRPSSSEPNLLNIPIRTELGKQIRSGFIAPPGSRLLSVDLSNIELRICAHLSGDKEMIRAFEKGEDLHQKTADQIGVVRDIGKKTNFLVLYGGTYKRLYSELLETGIETTEKECDRIIREWFKLYRGVKTWLDDILARSRRRGFVRGMSGRLRYLPNLYMREGSPLRSEAERHAGNFPIQEGAGYLGKRAMKRMWKWIEVHPEMKVEPLLYIYDEHLFEVPKKHVKEVGEVMRKIVVADAKLLRVPLKADVAIGRDWGSL